MLLSELVCNSKLKYSCTNEIDYTKIEIKDITRDTRQVIDGSMFIAVIGVKVDGHDLINEAIEKGAKAIIHSKEINDIKDDPIFPIVNIIVFFFNVLYLLLIYSPFHAY